MPATTIPSIRRQLIRRLLVPLLALFLIGAFVSYWMALHFANFVYDRWLYDSARSLAQQVKIDSDRVRLDLPRAAIEMFEWDEVDRTYYAVTTRKQGLVFGHAAFPAPPVDVPADLRPAYYDAAMGGGSVRVVAVRLPTGVAGDEVTVQVAETLIKRHTLARQILLALILPQGVLLIAAGLLIWFGIAGGLRTLNELADQITARGPRDLDTLDTVVPAEVKPLTRALNDLLIQLAGAHAAQRRFIAHAAHQLRTPLSALQVHAERALRELNPDTHADALRHVLAGITRLNRLSNQLLTLARAEPEAGAPQNFAAVDLSKLAREVTGEWVRTAIRRDLDIGYDGPDAGAMTWGDPLLLRELLNNLIDNAIQYGTKGGKLTVGVGVDSAVTLYVDDDGPGIPPASREAVFERFYRLPGSCGNGCGLGLAIVREIAQLHGAAAIISDGESGRGTRVAIKFRPPAAGRDSFAYGRLRHDT